MASDQKSSYGRKLYRNVDFNFVLRDSTTQPCGLFRIKYTDRIVATARNILLSCKTFHLLELSQFI